MMHRSKGDWMIRDMRIDEERKEMWAHGLTFELSTRPKSHILTSGGVQDAASFYSSTQFPTAVPDVPHGQLKRLWVLILVVTGETRMTAFCLTLPHVSTTC